VDDGDVEGRVVRANVRVDGVEVSDDGVGELFSLSIGGRELFG